MTFSKLSKELGTVLAEMAGVWITVGILVLVAVLAFMNPPSRSIGVVYGILAVGAVVYSVFRTRTEIEKMRL